MAGLQGKLVEQLQLLHALKSAALRMFDPMLRAVARQRTEHALPEVEDLLGRMHGVFSGHRAETAEHERRLRRRLSDLGARPARALVLGLGAGALVRGNLDRVRGQNHGAAARDAFVFENLEIASWRLLERLAERADDPLTAELARSAGVQDEDMAAAIGRNWDNVLSLMLAADGIPTGRTAPGPAPEPAAG